MRVPVLLHPLTLLVSSWLAATLDGQRRPLSGVARFFCIEVLMEWRAYKGAECVAVTGSTCCS